MKTNEMKRMGAVLPRFLLVAAMIAVPLILPCEAGAVTCPTTSTTDTDLDGFSDKCECSPGIVLGNQTSVVLDPNKKDLFVYLQRASGSLLTETNNALFQPITNAAAPPGLGVVLHVYDTNFFVPSTDRQVGTCSGATITQKGAWITEDNISADGTSGSLLGSTNVISTPNAIGNASTVYTLRLQNFVNNTCTNYTKCIDNTFKFGRDPANPNTSMADLYKLYQRQNVNHELAHQMALVPQPVPVKGKTTGPTVTNSHYPSAATGSAMEYSVYYKTDSTTSTVTWYIPTNFIQYDVNSKKLK